MKCSLVAVISLSAVALAVPLNVTATNQPTTANKAAYDGGNNHINADNNNDSLDSLNELGDGLNNDLKSITTNLKTNVIDAIMGALNHTQRQNATSDKSAPPLNKRQFVPPGNDDLGGVLGDVIDAVADAMEGVRQAGEASGASPEEIATFNDTIVGVTDALKALSSALRGGTGASQSPGGPSRGGLLGGILFPGLL